MDGIAYTRYDFGRSSGMRLLIVAGDFDGVLVCFFTFFIASTHYTLSLHFFLAKSLFAAWGLSLFWVLRFFFFSQYCT